MGCRMGPGERGHGSEKQEALSAVSSVPLPGLDVVSLLSRVNLLHMI